MCDTPNKMVKIIDLETALQQKKGRTVLYDHPSFCIFTDSYYSIFGDKIVDTPINTVTKIIDHKSNMVVIFGNQALMCYKKQGYIYINNDLSFYVEYNNIIFKFYDDGIYITAYNSAGNTYKDLDWLQLLEPVKSLEDFARFLGTIDEIYDPALLSSRTVIYDLIKRDRSINFKSAYYDIQIIVAEDS